MRIPVALAPAAANAKAPPWRVVQFFATAVVTATVAFVTSHYILPATTQNVPAAKVSTSTAGLEGSPYLRAERAPYAAEIEKKPALRLRAAAIASLEHESDAAAVIESLVNRSAYTGRSLESGMGGGAHSFYGPVRRGLVPAREAELVRNPARLARLNKAIDQVLAGSNLLRGATDQGSPSDPNGAWQGGRMVRYGEVYNDWGGGPGGHAGAARWREEQQRHVREGGGAKVRPKRMSGAAHTSGSAASEFFPLRQSHRYGATVNLHGVEQFLASNDMIAGGLRQRGFTEVEVTGAGALRSAKARWSAPDTRVSIDPHVTNVHEILDRAPER